MVMEQDVADQVEQLIARHGCYRPVDLLVALRQLSADALAAWRAGRGGEHGVLEDAIAGDPERWMACLRAAADWAERRGLEPALVVPVNPDRRALSAARGPARQQLLCTEYRRVEQGPQLDLFFDNPGLIARNRLVEALLSGDDAQAAERLAEIDTAAIDQALQTAAELLVDALAWSPGRDLDAAMAFVEQQLVPAAQQFLERRAGQFLRPYWRALARMAEGLQFDPTRPERHASALHLRAGNPAGTVETIRAEPEYWGEPGLLVRIFDAGTMLGDRNAMLEAIIELCWTHERQALECLNRCPDPAVGLALEQFGEAPGELPWALFPAWLALLMPLPEPASLRHPGPRDDDATPRRAFTAAIALRRQPADIDARRALYMLAPELFRHWLTRAF